MKKNYISILFLFSMVFSLQINAQSNRMALIEEATQASCPPCASLNPPLQALVNANPDKVIFLGYQVWWPGYDPMYEDNPQEVDVRVGDYYGFGFAPQIVMQGSFVTGGGNPGALGNLNQAKIDAIADQPSEFDMTLSAAIENGQLKVTGDVIATADVSGDLRLRIAIIEHIIDIADAPGGTNGETEYHNVFKKFIGGTNGFDLADAWVAGDSIGIDETFDLGTLNIYNYAEVQVIAFVQDDATKFVHQAVQAKDVDITVDFENNSGALGITELPPFVCPGDQTISPSVQIQNNGNADLTSLDIVYNVNGGTDQTYNWTGSLATLEKTTVILDPYTFFAETDNTINVTLANPNGVADEENSDNSSTASLGLAPEGATEYTITLNFDCWAEENSWELKNSAGDVVASNSYTAANSQTQVVENYTLDPNDCYTFSFFDSFGDGMNGSQWGSCTVDGNITIEDNFGHVVYNYDGSYDTSEEVSVFSSTFVSSVNEAGLKEQVAISPNPTSGILNVNISGTIDNVTQVQVFSLAGKMIQYQEMNSPSFNLDLSSCNNGIYLVRLVNGEKAVTQRVTVQK